MWRKCCRFTSSQCLWRTSIKALTLRGAVMATAGKLQAALGKATKEVCGHYGNTQPLKFAGKPIHGILAPQSPKNLDWSRCMRWPCLWEASAAAHWPRELGSSPLSPWSPSWGAPGADIKDIRPTSQATPGEDTGRWGHLHCSRLQAHLQWLQNPVSTRQGPWNHHFSLPSCLPLGHTECVPTLSRACSTAPHRLWIFLFREEYLLLEYNTTGLQR